MFGKLLSKSKSIIGRNSNENIVVQNSTISNLVMLNETSDNDIKLLAQMGEYKKIEELITNRLSVASTLHPLFPDFSAKYNSDLNRLISTPETEEAFKNHPKKIKITCEFDYKKYPYMDKSETPWEYAFRTQTKVQLQTKAYNEFLGDMEDPFPEITNADKLITVIGAPEFPPAVEAQITSEDIQIPVLFRRIPCFEYGKIAFGVVSSGHGFDFEISYDITKQNTTIHIKKLYDGDWEAQLLREKLINSIRKSTNFRIMIKGKEVVSIAFKESELSADMFRNASILIRYYQCLLFIEEKVGCRFDKEFKDVDYNDYLTAITMSASISGKWQLIKKEFDDGLRCDYDEIDEYLFLFENIKALNEMTVKMNDAIIFLHGLKFIVNRFTIIYKEAKINNANSVYKSINRKKKNIRITIKPQEGKETFNKYMYFEGISQLN